MAVDDAGVPTRTAEAHDVGGSGGSHRAEPVTSAEDDTPKLSSLLGELTTELSTLMRQEVALAKAEVRVEAKHAGKAAGKLAAAAVIGLVAVFLLSWALAFLIGLFTETWIGFAVVGILYAVVAAVLGNNGKKQMQEVDPKPQHTVETLKEDKEWIQNR